MMDGLDRTYPARSGADVEKLQFLNPEDAVEVREKFGTPAYVYDLARLKEQAGKVLDFPNAFGLTVRYAMKASPNAAILKVFRKAGLHIDASSGHEVRRAVASGKERRRRRGGGGQKGMMGERKRRRASLRRFDGTSP